jgi:tocopherol O-methyltransferase
MSSPDAVAAYYDTHQSLYTRFWSEDALHYGYWYADTRTLAEAIVNENRFILDTLEINENDVVLDAGCGVAGTAIFIAKATGARVEGVTLSQVQLAIARTKIAAAGLTDAVSVSVQNFQSTRFPDATFTKQFGLGSICHGSDKDMYAREAYRMMRPGGRLAIADVFLAERSLSAAEVAICNDFIEGWEMSSLLRRSEFESLLSSAGFVNMKFIETQQYIWPSVRKLYRYGLITAPVNLILHQLGLTRRNVSAFAQKATYEKGIARYGVLVAERP